MLELLAEGGKFVAILILCATCWIAGRSIGGPSVGGSDVLADERMRSPQPAALDDAERALLGQVEPSLADEKAQVESSALAGLRSGEGVSPQRPHVDELYNLIRTGDLSKEGVIQSLVALAEERTQQPNERKWPSWSVSGPMQREQGSCESPRILTRKAMSEEPLPAELSDPLTPEVLSRYRVYAEEYGVTR